MGFISGLFGGQAKNPLDNVDFGSALQNTLNDPFTRAIQAPLAQQLQAQAAGTGGPNLAQTQLQHATDQNTQQAAGLVGSTRGINPGLAARQIAGSYANANQQAANESAQLQQRQQLAAQEQLAGLSGQTGQQQIGMANALSGGAAASGNIAGGNAGRAQQASGGLLGGLAGAAGGLLGFADGGEVPFSQRLGDAFNAVGAAPQQQQQPAQEPQTNPFSMVGQLIGGGVKKLLSPGVPITQVPMSMEQGGPVPGHSSHPGNNPENDTVPAMLSPGEVVLPRSVSHDPEKAKEFLEALHGQHGEEEPEGYAKVLKSEQNLKKRKSGKH